MNPIRRYRQIIWIPLLICGCSWISYYDPTTFKNLTDLKAEVSTLYDSFANARADSARIQSVQLRLRQVFEYEKGKGEKNAETAKQVEIIRAAVDRHIQNRLTEGPWSSAHLANTKENIEGAFDIAIKTERLKNKNE